MIQPSIGRVLHFYPALGLRDPNGQPLAALLAKVIDDRTVNLTVSNADGSTYGVQHVPLLQDNEVLADPDAAHAAWMPYQKGQAAKTEAVQAAAAPIVVNVSVSPPLAPAAPVGHIEAIARVCHEANRAYCASQGDLSQPTWEDAPDWQRSSAIAGVTYALGNPQATPADSHESWLREKTADGWTYGPVKDPTIKQHPCFVPYDQLPPAQKAKDYIFLAIVRELAAA